LTFIYGCGTRPVTLRTEQKHSNLENEIFQNVYGAKKDKFGRNGENLIIIVFMICPNYQILLE
jgi:hypothetical protein